MISSANMLDAHQLFIETPTLTLAEDLEEMINEGGQAFDGDETQNDIDENTQGQDTQGEAGHGPYNDGQDSEDGEGVDIDGEPFEFLDEPKA